MAGVVASAPVSHEMVRPPRGGTAGVKAPASVSHEMVKTSTGGRGRGTNPRVRGEPKDGKDLHGGARPGWMPRVRMTPVMVEGFGSRRVRGYPRQCLYIFGINDR
jgi:hypothetical protein